MAKTKKVSKEERKRLLDEQHQELATGGVLITNKEWGKGTVRVLPTGGKNDVRRYPGLPFYDDFSSSANKGTTSPKSYGLACPLRDARDTLLRGLSKKERDKMYQAVKPSMQMWTPVILRNDPEETMRIFRMPKKSVYDKFTEWGREDDDDPVDQDEGVDLIIKRKGTGRDTKWDVQRGAQCPLSEDEESYDRLCELGRTMDVRSYFYEPDWDLITEMYYTLTGEDLPDHYKESWDASPWGGGGAEYDDEEGQETDEAAGEGEEDCWAEGDKCRYKEEDGEYSEGIYQSDDGEHAKVDFDGEVFEIPLDDLEEVEEEEDAEAEEEEGEPEAEDEDDGYTEGDRVKFESDGDDYEGVYQGPNEEGEIDVEVDGEVWSIEPDNLTKVEEEEPEEEPPDVKRAARPKAGKKSAKKKSAKKKSAKKPAPRKATAKKPTVKKKIKGKKAAKKTTAKKGRASSRVRKGKKR